MRYLRRDERRRRRKGGEREVSIGCDGPAEHAQKKCPPRTDRKMKQKLPRKTQIASSKGHMAGGVHYNSSSPAQPRLTTCK